MKPLVIGLAGRVGSGKTTAARHLVEAHGYRRTRFAEPLKAMLRAMGLTEEHVDGALKEVPCALLGGHTPRYAMQTLGTEWGRQMLSPTIWTEAWGALLDREGLGLPGFPVVADDCRFQTEAAAVRARGGVVIRIARPGVDAAPVVHASEILDFEPDVTIENVEGDPDALRRALDHLVLGRLAA